MNGNLVLYREDLLPYSETFILNQGESLRQFTPYYVGTRRVDGIATPAERTIVLDHRTPLGRSEELLYKATGFSPQLLRRVRAVQPLLLHAHFGFDGAMVLPLVRRLRRPLIVTFHGRDATMRDEYLKRAGSLRERRLVAWRSRLIREGALFIAVSEHIRRQLLDQGFPHEKVVTHYNGIDTRFFTPEPGTPPAAEPTVLFVGRFVEKKGAFYLLRAMHAVQRLVPEARLVLIGDGPQRPALEALAQQLGLRCAFVGKQPLGVVREHLRAAWVFCLPSVTASNGDTEGLPTVLLEALATGLPTVTTASAGNPEAVRDGETGLVVAERDETALARALVRLLRDESLRCRLALAGRRAVEQGFDAERQARGLEALYLRVLGQTLSEVGRQPARTRMEG
ncbi:glycosyltransferase [Deinococcus geothermalis]|uniref:glycosyltransferase n=1 Tax=Deinococcus geothermalis TaxID=68909 RepID=UPI002353DAE2|nr:glycosyltransferase [Deinococcus geothermalis]